MALGRNLKKKSLIPSKKDEMEAENKKSSSKKVKAKKTVGAEEAKTEESATKGPAEVTEQKKVEQPVPKPRPLNKDEFEKRQSLHQKFHDDVEALKEKQVHLIVFEIDGEEYAIEIFKVDEVVATPLITKMPMAPDYIPGLATIRGKGVVTLDLALKLGVEGSSKENHKDRTQYTVVIKTNRFNVGLLIPKVPYNRIVPGNSIQSTSDNVAETALDETYIKGLIRVNERMIYFIDIDALIEADRLKSRVVNE